MIFARLLISNGSTLNVCLLITLDHLGVGRSFIRESRMLVRTFYVKCNGRRSITFIRDWPFHFEVPLVVVDNPARFNVARSPINPQHMSDPIQLA